jgi:hypothetical protein
MNTSHKNANPFIERLRADPSLTHPQDLSDWGARAAVIELLESWEPALREESPFRDVIGDVDHVIEKLQAFKARAIAHHRDWTAKESKV